MSEANTRDSLRYIAPKALLLFICFSLCFVPSIPFKTLGIISSEYENTVKVLLPLICDPIQVECWRPFHPVLDYASYISLTNGQDASTKRIIRKSDSLHVILKGLSLKVAPTAVTSTIVIKDIGFSLWSAFSLTITLLLAMGGINFFLFIPFAKKIQECKRIRDDNVENGIADSDMQTAYTAALKANARLRRRWNIFLSLGTIAALLFVTDTTTYLRLVHQIRSVDEAYEKTAQSFPKAIKIINEMQKSDGITQQICKACMQTTKVMHMSLYDVKEFGFLKGGSISLFAEALPKVVYKILPQILYRGARRPFVDLEQGVFNNSDQEPVFGT